MLLIPLVKILDSHGTIRMSRGITRRTGKENITTDSRGKGTKGVDELPDEARSPGIRQFLRARYGCKAQNSDHT